MQVLAARRGTAMVGLALGLVVLGVHAGEAAEFEATSRISLENGGALGNVVTTGSPPAVSSEFIECNPVLPGGPYFSGSADTVADNGTGSINTDTRTCYGPLPKAVQSFETLRWTWDDVLITGPAGPVAVNVNLLYSFTEDGAGPYTLTFKSRATGSPELPLPSTGGAWTSYSHPLNINANTPTSISIDYTLDYTAGHYSWHVMSIEMSLANIVFDLPPGYTANVPSAGVVDNVFVGTDPPVPPVPALSTPSMGLLIISLLAATIFALRRKQEGRA